MSTFFWLGWLVFGALLLIGEIFTVSFYLSLIGVSCLLAGFVAFWLPLRFAYIPAAVFVAASVLSLIFIRPLCLRFLYNKNVPKANVDSLIGKTVTALTDIVGSKSGTVKIYADIWQARTDENVTIGRGTLVTVTNIDGNTLFVCKTPEGSV